MARSPSSPRKGQSADVARVAPPPAEVPRPVGGRPWVVVAAVAALCATLGVLWGTTLPLGIEGEWTWPRLNAMGAEVLAGTGTLVALVVGGAWLLWMWAGDRRIADAERFEKGAWWAGAVCLGGAWYATVVGGAPFPHGAGRAAWVLFYPGPSGYYTEARGAADRRQYLAGYRARVERGDDVLHIGTHPPGLVAAYWILDDLRRDVPLLDSALAATLPDEVREWWGLIDEQTRLRGGTVPVGDERLLWFAAVVVGLSVVLGVWPLAWLVTREYGPVVAWRVAGLLPAVPALAMFWPKSDTLLAGVALGLMAAWVFAWDRKTRIGAALSGAAAGLLGWLGVNLTLGLLPTFAWLGVWTVAEGARGEGPFAGRMAVALRRLAAPLAGFLATFVGLTVATWWLFDLALPAVWLANLRNHAGFYDVYPRSYLGWLLVNPFELAVALGGPMAVCAVFAVCRRMGRVSPSFWATVVVAGLLWLSGKNSGEAARLWEFQSGWWLLVAAPVLAGIPAVAGIPGGGSSESGRTASDEPSGNGEDSRVWLALWGLQLVACAGTAWRVGGFHVPGQ